MRLGKVNCENKLEGDEILKIDIIKLEWWVILKRIERENGKSRRNREGKSEGIKNLDERKRNNGRKEMEEILRSEGKRIKEERDKVEVKIFKERRSGEEKVIKGREVIVEGDEKRIDKVGGKFEWILKNGRGKIGGELREEVLLEWFLEEREINKCVGNLRKRREINI